MYEILEHPADVGFRAHGATLPKLFEAAAEALLNIRSDLETIQPSQEYKIEAAAPDQEALLVTWLNEILYRVDAQSIAISSVSIDHLEDTKLQSTAHGEPFDPVRHHLHVIIKAVTWHQLKIARTGANWVAEVYLDV